MKDVLYDAVARRSRKALSSSTFTPSSAAF